MSESDTVALALRVEAIEARQREYGMHDPDCPQRRSSREQMESGAYIIPKACECWLSAGEER